MSELQVLGLIILIVFILVGWRIDDLREIPRSPKQEDKI